MTLQIFSTTAEWLAARKHSIGASESPALMGANPWRGSFAVYAGKVGEHEEEETSKMRAGQVFERAIAEFYAIERDLQLLTPLDRARRDDPELEAAPYEARVMWRAPGSVLACTPDFFVSDGAEGEWPVEVKRVDPDQSPKWKEGPPLYYVLQVQHQLGVLRACGMQYDEAVLVADFGGDDVRPYYIRFDAELWELIVRTCESFWLEHVGPKNPPAVDHLTTPEDVGRLYKRAVVGSTVEVPLTLLARYRDLKAQEKALSEALEQAQAALKAAIGEHEGATVGGVLCATWKERVANIPAKAATVSKSRPLLLTKAAQGV
jgi:predicted phage-related endonuclease